MTSGTRQTNLRMTLALPMVLAGSLTVSTVAGAVSADGLGRTRTGRSPVGTNVGDASPNPSAQPPSRRDAVQGGTPSDRLNPTPTRPNGGRPTAPPDRRREDPRGDRDPRRDDGDRGGKKNKDKDDDKMSGMERLTGGMGSIARLGFDVGALGGGLAALTAEDSTGMGKLMGGLQMLGGAAGVVGDLGGLYESATGKRVMSDTLRNIGTIGSTASMIPYSINAAKQGWGWGNQSTPTRRPGTGNYPVMQPGGGAQQPIYYPMPQPAPAPHGVPPSPGGGGGGGGSVSPREPVAPREPAAPPASDRLPIEPGLPATAQPTTPVTIDPSRFSLFPEGNLEIDLDRFDGQGGDDALPDSVADIIAGARAKEAEIPSDADASFAALNDVTNNIKDIPNPFYDDAAGMCVLPPSMLPGAVQPDARTMSFPQWLAAGGGALAAESASTAAGASSDALMSSAEQSAAPIEMSGDEGGMSTGEISESSEVAPPADEEMMSTLPDEEFPMSTNEDASSTKADSGALTDIDLAADAEGATNADGAAPDAEATAQDEIDYANLAPEGTGSSLWRKSKEGVMSSAYGALGWRYESSNPYSRYNPRNPLGVYADTTLPSIPTL